MNIQRFNIILSMNTLNNVILWKQFTIFLNISSNQRNERKQQVTVSSICKKYQRGII